MHVLAGTLYWLVFGVVFVNTLVLSAVRAALTPKQFRAARELVVMELAVAAFLALVWYTTK